MILYSDEYATF